MKEVFQRVDYLRKEIIRHQYLYYILNQPEISDREYDRLFDELLQLETRYPELKTADSPTQRIGSDLENRFEEKPLPVNLLSLDKVYAPTELFSWMEKLETSEKCSFIAEQKIDGASILLHYKDGRLFSACTRGNGTVGNDVTENVKTIKQVPLSIAYKKEFAVRGEIYISRNDFQLLNERFENRFANPRNLAAGTLRTIKSSAVSKIPLQIFVYDLYPLEEPPMESIDACKLLQEMGFRTNPHFTFFSNSEEKLNTFRKLFPGQEAYKTMEIFRWVEKQRELRNQLPYEIDGLVIKVNEPEVRSRLGETSHHPRYSLAYKFESPVATTIVKDIQVQIGRNGRVTPVAILEPVKIAGSTVSRATLHNQEYICLLELNIGDLVAISKRGDIIPAVEKVIEKGRAGAPCFKISSTCPFCWSKLVTSGAHHFCKNDFCPERRKRALIHFCSKNGLDIEGLGEKTIEFLFQQGFVQEIPDIYTFDYQLLISFEGFKAKKIARIRESVNRSKMSSFKQVILAIGLEGLGEIGVKRLIDSGFNSIDKLLEVARNNDLQKLNAVEGMGEITARNLISQLRDPAIQNLIRRLQQLGLQFSQKIEISSEETKKIFAGQVWAITGSFENFKPRELAAAEIEKRGGTIVSSISQKTTHLLVGSDPGSKLDKAKNLKIKIISEPEFLQLLGKD